MASNFGNGQMQPADTASPFNAVSFVIQQMLARVRTTVVVKVKAVTNAGGLEPVGFVDVQPLVNMLDGAGTATPHGTIFNLAYFRLQGGSNAIIMDPHVDDIGYAVIADRDISSVKATKEQANPGSLRRFDLADGIYVGGILNGTPEQYVAFTESGVKMADKNGNVIEMKAGSIDVTTVAFRVNGAIVAGFGGADAIGLQTHVHPANGSPPSPGT